MGSQRRAAAAALLALLAIAGAGALVAAGGRADLSRPLDGDGRDGERVAGLMLAARAADRFGLLYPTIATGWRAPTLAALVLSRPPATDLVARVVFAFAGERPAAARAAALVAAVLAVLAIGRAAWIAWGPWAGAAAAALLAFSPYVGAYATHPHPGMPALAAAAMALGSLVRFRRTRGRLHAVAAIVWTLVAGLYDWSAYLIVVPLAAMAAAGRPLARLLLPARPQAVGLPEGLSGPLASILSRREGDTALTLTAALGIALGAELLFFLGWYLKLGALGGFFSTLAGAGAEPPVSVLAPPAPLAPSLVGVAGAIVVVVWAGVALTRVLFGQADARSLPAVALLGASALYAICFRALAVRSFHLPALAVGGVVLATVDLAASVGGLLVARRLLVPEPPPAAVAVSLALALGAAAVNLPAWRQARAARPTDDVAGAESRAFAHAVADATEAGDRALALARFPLGLRFLLAVDRDVEMIATLDGLEARRARDRHLVVMLAEPLPAGEPERLGALLREHPAVRIGARWLVDLGRYEPGIASYAAAGPRALTPLHTDGFRLALRYGVAPSRDYLPALDELPDLSRAELYAYQNVAGLPEQRARARARLLEGLATTPRWMDPAPLGQPEGVRFAAGERRLDLVWECLGAAAARPAGVTVGSARFVLHTGDRAEAFDRAVAAPCPAAARAGDLREQSFTFKTSLRGHVHVAVQLLRDGKPRRPLNPAPVEIGTVEIRPEH